MNLRPLCFTLIALLFSLAAQTQVCSDIYEWRPDEPTIPFARYDRDTRGPETLDHGQSALIAENNTAVILTQFGFRVRQNPEKSKNQDIVEEFLWRQEFEGLDTNKNPDYLINRNIFDHYAPEVRSPPQIALAIMRKVNVGQTHRVVVDLTENPAKQEGAFQLRDLIFALKKKANENLWEVSVIHGTRNKPRVSTIWPEVAEHHSPFH